MRIYFKFKSILLIIFTPMIYFLFGILLYFAILSKELIAIILSILFILLITTGIFFGSIYGFKIDSRYIRIVSQQRVKKYKIENIKNIEITFKKIKSNYKVVAYVFLYEGKTPIKFVWDDISSYRGPSLKYNITDKNINKYIEKLSSFNFFTVNIEQ